MGKGNDTPCRGGDDCRDEDHLCRVAKRMDEKLIRELVRDSRFFCRKCGRAAHDEVNLCKPVKI
jgi:hypothetical protein